MKKNVRIANGQGFWGDSYFAPRELIDYGNIDYLTLDYLAEVTISIMQRQKNKNKKLGYALDFVDLIDEKFNSILDNNIKVISNAGGVNPSECRKQILELSKKYNRSIKVAIVKGDDIFSNIDDLISSGQKFKNMNSGESIDSIRSNMYSANVYIDSFCIADALSLGADIVLCGRISDPGLVVGPCVYEFSWRKDNYNQIASATVAGHIIECGAQCTGGNFSKWSSIKDFSNIGYPIVEISSNGNFKICKPDNTSGLVSIDTVSEQILYELGDPKNYISPDVIVDFTSFKLAENNGEVFVSGVLGFEPTDTFKVSISYFNGYKSSGQLTVFGAHALEKAIICSDSIKSRLANYGAKFDQFSTEFLGLNSCSLDVFTPNNKTIELVLRLGVKSFDKKSVEMFTKQLSPLITSGPPGITGFSDGRPKIREIVAFWPALISKSIVNTRVEM